MISPTQKITFSTNMYFVKTGRCGFKFMKINRRYRRLLDKKQDIIEKIGGELKSFWRFGCWIILLICLALAYIEMCNIVTSFGGIYYSVGDMGSTKYYVAGFIFAASSLFLGYGLREFIKESPITGRNVYTVRWWLCLTGSVIYVYAVYRLALAAGAGVGSNGQGIINATVIYTVIIAIIEILFGFLFLHEAILYIHLCIVECLMGVASSMMSHYAQATEESWYYYLHVLSSTNGEPKEPTENVVKARDYYQKTGSFKMGSFTNEAKPE